MIPEFEFITHWLIETFVHGTAILVIAIAALSSIKQPARRMPVAWGAFAGLVALAILPALSWWPRVELPGWLSAATAAQAHGLKGEATIGRGIRENSRGSGIRKNSHQVSPRVGILTNSATHDMTSTGPYRAFDEPLGADLVVMDETPPARAGIVSVPQDMDAESKTERVTSIDVERAHPSWQAITTGLWLAGALLVSIWIAAGALRTQRLFRRSCVAPGWVRDDLRRIVPAHRREPIARVSQEIAAALAYGAIRPAILLRDPQLRDALAEPEARRAIRAALAHEYAHIAHGDLWLLALERLLLPVYFAHPLFWVLRRWIRIDQELRADAAAAADRPVEYAEALLEWAKSAPAAGSPRFAAALPLWNSPCHLKRRIEMLLDAGNPIVRQASRLWRAAVMTTIAVVVMGLSLVTLHPAHSAENADDRPSAVEAVADAGGSGPRPAPVAATDPIPAAHIVAFGITLVQVDNSKLAGRETSLAKLVDTACDPARRSKSKEDVIAGSMPVERAQKLVEDIKTRDAATILGEPRISAVFETNRVYPSPAEGANAARQKNVSFKNGDLLITVHAQPIDRGRHEPIRLKVSAGVEFTPQADSDSSGDRNLQVLSSLTRKVSYAAELQLGDSLIIACGTNDPNSAVKPDFAILTVVTPLTVTPVADPNSHAAQSRDVESLRKVVEELKEEIRGLRQKPPHGADRPEVPGPAGVGRNIERELLLLDVQEAEVNVSAAKAAYELAQEDKNIGAASPAELAGRLAALRKSQIALERAKLRADAAGRPQAAIVAPDNQRDGTEEASNLTEKLRELEALEIQNDLDAARAAYDHAVSLHNKGSVGASELAARKLALQIAQIAKYRIELRAKSLQSPTVDPKKGSSKLEHGRDAIQKQKMNIKSLESQLEAAKTKLKPQLDLLSRYTTQTAGSPTDVLEGFQFSPPLGIRDAAAQVRNAELRLMKAKAVLAAMELELTPEPTSPTVDPKKGSSKLEHGRDAIQKQKLNIKSLESQLEAAKNQIKSQHDLSRSYSTQTAANPTGFNVGFQFSVPLGLRNALAQVRNTELRLNKAKEALAGMEREISSEPTENPPQPDTEGARKRDNKVDERQIVLRARIVEIPFSSLQKIQAEHSDAMNLNTFFAEIAPGRDATLSGILDSGDITVLNKLIDTGKKAKVVFDSRVTVRSGHSARFLSKGEMAVLTPADKDVSGRDSISFRGTGITLSVVATAQDSNLTRLQIVPEFSTIDAETTVNGIPGVNTRRVQTTVELRDGQTVALAAPTSSSDSNTRVLILLTPQIVSSTDSSPVSEPESRKTTTPLPEPATTEPKGGAPKAKTQSANTAAARPHNDEFWRKRKLEEQLAPPLSLPPKSSAVDVLPSAESKITPELEGMLTAWAQATSQIKRFQCSFTNFIYDHKQLVETRAEGGITVDAPDRAYYFVTAASLNGATESQHKCDGKAYELHTEDGDRAWLWAAGHVMQLDMRRKFYETTPLDNDEKPAAEGDQFYLARPFLLGMSVPQMVQRFAISLTRKDESEVWLSLIPRQSEPPAPYREAILILSPADWHPRALKLTDPRGEVESVHIFRQFVNPPTSGTIHSLLDVEDLSEFLKVWDPTGRAQPWPIAPGADPVFRTALERNASLATLEAFEMSTVRAPRTDIPGTLRMDYVGGVKVTAVIKGGVADAAGILPNDILVGLHVWKLLRQEDLHDAARQIAAKDFFDKQAVDAEGIAVVLIRDGDVLKTKIKPKPWRVK